MPFFRIHYKTPTGLRKHYDTFECSDKAAAERCALSLRETNKDCAELLRVTRLGRVQSPKQKLASQYRFLKGTIMSAEAQLYRVDLGLEPSEKIKEKTLRAGASKHLANAKRDIAELFKRLGINAK